MTESEAKKYMLIEKECINRDCNRDCANCDIVQNVEDLNNAYDVAIQALEKQIPKKPKTDDRYVMHICPWCNDFVKVSHNYCQNCGQKLDWGNEEYGKNES